MDFIPDEQDDSLVIPFFEDASGQIGVSGYSTTKSESVLKSEIERWMARMGAGVAAIQSGKMGARYAYQIEFIYHGRKGRMRVVALPIRSETPARIKQAKAQALFSVARKLEAQYNAMLNSPDDFPFMLNLLDDKGKTLIEVLQEQGTVPALPEPKEPVPEAEWREV